MTATKTLNTRRSMLSVFLSLVFATYFTVVVSAYECPGSSKTPPLVLKGKRFYDSSTDEYVPIKGIAYYPRPNAGPLTEGHSVDFYTDEYSSRWQTDIQNMKDLGVNAIRIYAVDPSANHDAFMCALSEAGIYVMMGLLADCEGCAIGAWVGVDAEPPLCYTSSVKERGKYVIRSFSKYPNTMAFSAGNEVTIYADDGAGGPREANVPCQKKFLRDMREYVSGCAGSYPNAVLPRAIPIGVVNWDGNAQSFNQHVYYYCRTDPEDLFENAEWFALNSYRHCDGSATSAEDIVGWPALRNDFQAINFPGPVLLGEYGCRERGFPTLDGFEAQRTWFQTEALYSPDYSDVFAGGFVFEYSAEKKVVDVNLQFFADKLELDEPSSKWPYEKFAKIQYGVGYFGPADCQHDDSSTSTCEYTKYPEWDGLVEALAKSEGRVVRPQSAGVVPECPSRFRPLSFYDWPTDSEEDIDLEYCLQLQSTNDVVVTDAPTVPVTESPSVASVDTVTDNPAATESPSAASVDTVTDNPAATESPTASTTSTSTTITTEAPTEGVGGGPETRAPSFSFSDESMAPTAFLTTATTQGAECSDHSRCAAQNLTGVCCPTVDDIYLGCCDVVDAAAADESKLESSAPQSLRIGVAVAFNHLALAALSALTFRMCLLYL